MRGSPLIRAGLVMLALLALLLPLRSLTRERAAEPPTPAPDARAAQAVILSLTSTARPTRFTVTHLGRPLWSGETTGTTLTTEVRLPFPPEGIDLGLTAQWAGGTTGAVRLGVSPNGGDVLERTAWGEGSIDDVLTFR